MWYIFYIIEELMSDTASRGASLNTHEVPEKKKAINEDGF
jgi:hypothetical protein